MGTIESGLFELTQDRYRPDHTTLCASAIAPLKTPDGVASAPSAGLLRRASDRGAFDQFPLNRIYPCR